MPHRCPLLALLILGFLAAPASAQNRPIQVLLIGNSLTAANDLPRLLAAVANAGGDLYETESVTGPGLALIDHLQRSTRAAATIARHRWDVVILQQGPTPAGICRDSLVLWAQLFDSLIVHSGARPALMMTWPPRADWAAFEETRVSYEAAAYAVNGIFLPVGEAWRLAGKATAPRLYAADGFHPSLIGSYLAALTIYERLSGQDIRHLSPAQLAPSSPMALSEADLKGLQEAAHEANTRYPDPAGPPTRPRHTPALPTAGHC